MGVFRVLGLATGRYGAAGRGARGDADVMLVRGRGFRASHWKRPPGPISQPGVAAACLAGMTPKEQAAIAETAEAASVPAKREIAEQGCAPFARLSNILLPAR